MDGQTSHAQPRRAIRPLARVEPRTNPTGGAVRIRFDFAKIDNVPNWKDVSPRLGVAYDFAGNGKSAIKVSVGRYVQSESTTLAAANNPANAIVTSATRTWNDTNGDYTPQAGELGPLSNGLFGTVVINTRYGDDVLTGFAARPYSWQAAASLQHELRPGIGLTGGYYCTWFGNFSVTDNVRVTPDMYDPFCVTVPVDPRLPGSGGNPLCGLYDIRPTAFGLVDNLVTQASRFGKQTELYDGIEGSINARFPRGALIAGGLSTGRTVTNNCDVVVDSPQRLYCRNTVPLQGQTQIKINGIYPLPWDFLVSAVFQNLPGLPIAATHVYTNEEIAPSLGRNLGQCRGAVTCNGTGDRYGARTEHEVRESAYPGGRAPDEGFSAGPSSVASHVRCLQSVQCEQHSGHQRAVRPDLASANTDPRGASGQSRRAARFLAIVTSHDARTRSASRRGWVSRLTSCYLSFRREARP